jgi:hypothetical protein
MNPNRWLLELSCGHEVWVTATGRPKRNVQCQECVTEQREFIDSKKKKGKNDLES